MMQAEAKAPGAVPPALVTATFEDGVSVVTLNRPDKRNALSDAMYAQLVEAFEHAQANPKVRVLLLQGAGDHFCAGNDIADFAAVAMGARAHTDLPVHRLLEQLARFDKPLVAAVKGFAVGIGTTLLLHADLVFVAEDAKLSTPFVNLALAPEAASSLLLPMRIGHPRAFAMFALGQTVDGRTAVEWGLANACAKADGVEALAQESAHALARRPIESVRATKRLMRDPEALWSLMQRETAVFGAQLSTPEAREAFAAFAERREPDFRRL